MFKLGRTALSVSYPNRPSVSGANSAPVGKETPPDTVHGMTHYEVLDLAINITILILTICLGACRGDHSPDD